MNDPSFLGLIQNAALLLAAAYVSDLVTGRWRTGKTRIQQVILGLAIGVIGMAIMLTPWTLMPGIVFDTRSILIGLSGFFLGLLPATIIMAMTAAFRCHLGGAGAWTGIGVILASGVIGLAWRHFRRRPLADISWRELYLLGVTIHLVMLALMLTLPWEVALQVLSKITLPVLVIYPAATALLGALISNRLHREKVEDALCDSEERYRFLLNNTSDYVARYSLAGQLLFGSGAMCSMIGYRPEEIIGTSGFDRVHPDDRSNVQTALEEAAKTGLNQRVEYRAICKNGAYKWMEMSGNMVQDVHTGQKEIVAVVRDISDRKRANEENLALLVSVQEEKNRLSSLIDSITDEIWFADTHKRFTLANSSALKKFCLDPERMVEVESLAKSLVVLRPDGSARPVEEAPPLRALAGEVVTGQEELIQVPASGEFRYRQVNASPVRDPAGNIVGSVSVVRDITDQKQVEEKLAALISRQEAMLKAIPDIVVEVDQNKIYTWANQAGLDFFGEDMIGREAAFYFIGEQKTYDAVQPLFNGDENTIYLESWQRHKNGQERLLAWRCRVLKDEKGEVLGALSSASDITQAKQVEEEISKLNDELEERVRQRTTQLEATNKELEAFCYSVSHDLRAPLRGIDGFSMALLEDYVDRPLDETGKEFLGRIRKATHRMGHLIDDLLKLSRVTRAEFNYKPVDLSRIIQTLADKYQQENPDRVVEMVIQEDVIVKGDHYQLEIAMGNLMDNAWKFTGHSDNVRIEFGSTVRDGTAVYFIRDNGAGFEMVYANKLFDAFQRLHNQEEYAGTGIGLATVKRIIERHGGRIWAEGEAGKGAIFYFTVG